MKIGRILIVIIVIVVVSAAVYFYFGNSERPQIKLRAYLDENAVLYHQYDSGIIKNIAQWSGLKDEKQHEILNFIPDSSRLMRAALTDQSLVSWHINRQNNIEPLYWVFVGDDYNLSADTVLQGKPVGNLTEVKNGSKFFIAEGQQLVVFGTNGELMERVAAFEFYADTYLRQYPPLSFEGNVVKATGFLKNKSHLFQNVKLNAAHYSLDVQPVKEAYYYNLTLDSVANVCGDLNNGGFNKTVPISALSALQYNFQDASCIQRNLNEKLSHMLWDAEDKYQFKLSNLIDAWVEGGVTWMQCDFSGLKEDIAMVKLRYDAAPFATGNRFFTEYETIKIKNGSNEKSYTIARMLPDELANIFFSNDQKTQKLFVTQLNSHLYFSTNKKALLMLLNELVNKRFLENFSGHQDNTGRIFIRFPEIMKKQNEVEFNWTIKGSAGLTDHGIFVQGSVFKPNN